MDIAGLLDDMKERVRTRGATPLVGGGLLGSFTRGLLGLDPSEEDSKFSQDMMLKAYQTGQALSNTPTPLALAVAPAAIVKGAKSAKKALPQEKALETARKNAVEMLGLPENNTAMDRARALAAIDEADAAKRLHQFGNLDFQAVPIQEFKGKLTYKSPSYNKKQSSEYRIGEINNEPVLMRKSDHWGKFTTNIKEEDQIFQQIKDLIDTVPDDIFGRVGKNIQNWQLIGGIANKNADKIAELQKLAYSLPIGSNERYALYDQISKLENPKKSEAGYIPVSELVGKIPEKTAFIDSSALSNVFEVPFITLKNNNLRSRFAAFDPARINDRDLLASLAAFGIGIPTYGLLEEE